MKRSRLIISVMSAVVAFLVVLVIWRVGFYKPKAEPTEKTATIGVNKHRGQRIRDRRLAEANEPLERRMRHRRLADVNRPEDWRRRVRRQERRALDVNGLVAPGGLRHLSSEERAKLRERWESMSEEEREEFRAEIREGFDVTRQVNE